MKKMLLVILTILLVISISGCKSAPDSNSASNTPEWLNDLPPAGMIWGIGTAKQSSTSMSMTTAEARARTSVARQLDALVQAMFTDYNLDAGNVNNQANTSLQEDVSRQITNINLSGAQPIKRLQAKNGAWWFLVEYNKANARKEIASILGNEEALYAQFKTQQALQILDAQLAKNAKPIQVSE
ncbi:MAG: LPP20 family lipoprotein [Treponema sp.]|nr:LPP20 family lipoprotein [Treponema sp.]